MANNLFANKPHVVKAKQTVSFAAAGFDGTNTRSIFLIDNPCKSWVPGRSINGLTGFESGKGYYINALADMDKETYLIPPLVPTAATSEYTNRILAVGGTVTQQQVDAWNVFVAGCTLDGIYNKIKLLYLYLGGVEAARKLNAISTNFTQTWIGGPVVSASGIKGNGTSSYVDTNFNPSQHLTNYNWMFGAAILEDTRDAGATMGAFETLTAKWSLSPKAMDDYSSGSGVTHALRAETLQASSHGSWGLSRISNTNLALFRENIQVASGAPGTDTGRLPNMNLYLLCRNSTGGAQLFSTLTHKASYVTEGFTLAEWQSFQVRLSNLFTAIGR